MITTESPLEIAYLRLREVKRSLKLDYLGREHDPRFFKADWDFLQELSKHPGVHSLGSVRYRAKPKGFDNGVYSLQFTADYREESRILDQTLPWQNGLRVRRSEDSERHIEVIGGDNPPIIHLPENSQVLIQLVVGNPERRDSYRLVGHWIPELTEEVRTIRLPYIPMPLSGLDVFPPPIVRSAEVIR